MITAVRGRLEAISLDSVIIEVGGVSLRIFVPTAQLSDLGEIGQEIKLYTHLYVREDQLALYGFKMPQQLDLFEMLLGVAGVGPRAALNVLSAQSVEAVQLAIAQSSVDFLKKVPGIGPKTAGRIILELKGKLVETGSNAKAIAKAGASGDAKTGAVAIERMQLIEALTNLGYTPAEVQQALGSLPTDRQLSLEEQVLEALRYLGQ